MMDIKVLLADDHAVLREGVRMVLDAQPGQHVGNGLRSLVLLETQFGMGMDIAADPAQFVEMLEA